jgi:hypothetical protein
LVENGFIRIFGHAKYPQGPGSTQGARMVLRELLARPGHQFWPDAVSLTDAASYREPLLPDHFAEFEELQGDGLDLPRE